MEYQLRPYQREAVDRTLSDLASGRRRVINVLPTGAGKTEIMAATIDAHLDRNPLTSALVLSHLTTLTEQTFDRFRRRIGKRSLGILQGSRSPTVMNDIVISTMQTARSEKHIRKMLATLSKPPSLLVIDETHMLPTQSYETIASYFPGLPLIGYTATPFRQKKIMTNVFDTVSFSISLQELIDQRYLVPPEVRSIPTANQNEIDRIATVMGIYQTQEAGKKAIVFMRSIDEAKLLRNAFESCGILSRCVTSDVSATQRQQIFHEFKDRDTMVLTTVDVLTAGFDAPAVEAIFMPFGTKSPTQYIQRIGRGLRTHPNKSSCRVYMFGEAPTISNKEFEKLTSLVLKAGSSKPKGDTFEEDLETTFWPKGSELYEWTQSVVDAVHRMEKLGMQHFASLLNSKQFPKQYLQSIADILARLPKRKTSLPHGDKPVTEAQKSLLFNAGFPGEFCTSLNKGEAHMMISALMNSTNDPGRRTASKEFLVGEGIHQGKHVAELPFKYRDVILKQYPDSPLAQQIKAWKSRKQRSEAV